MDLLQRWTFCHVTTTRMKVCPVQRRLFCTPVDLALHFQGDTGGVSACKSNLGSNHHILSDSNHRVTGTDELLLHLPLHHFSSFHLVVFFRFLCGLEKVLIQTELHKSDSLLLINHVTLMLIRISPRPCVNFTCLVYLYWFVSCFLCLCRSLCDIKQHRGTRYFRVRLHEDTGKCRTSMLR